ncbi:MAG TPA: sulfate adenylyltransferase subunit CysD [Spirochaetes bacterium]|nr:sulfate adenylyltransferase subunit CysD [Spirochaetota bacterium]
MDHLSQLESRTIYIIREAYSQFKKTALLWSIGKDSTTMLWIARKAFFGEIPFPVIHIDTGFKLREIYEFRESFVELWDLNLIISRNEGAINKSVSPKNGKLECCNALKTEALKLTLKETGFDALLLAIRRDEHGIRAKERYFSPRDTQFKWNYKDQPAELWDLFTTKIGHDDHLRVHPMLHWTEFDIWKYIQREKIPTVGLYFAKDGKRYRSIGCAPCCAPVDSKARNLSQIIRELKSTKTAERSGRAQDKEDTYTMQTLRSLGYM